MTKKQEEITELAVVSSNSHGQDLGINTDVLQPILVASPLGSAGWMLDEAGFFGKPQ